MRYDSFLGPLSFKLSHTNISLSNMLDRLGYISQRFLDFTGIPFVKFPYFLNSPVQEDLAGYGLLWLLILPVLLITAIKIFVHKDFRKIFLFIAGVGYFFSFSFVVKPNPWILRLLIPMTAMISPLVGVFYPKKN